MFYLLIGIVIAVPFYGQVPWAFRSKLPRREQSRLQTHIGATESVSLCGQMRSWRRFWNSKQRYGVAESKRCTSQRV